MKKYFLGLIAILVAISFSAFTPKQSALNFLITSDPTTQTIVENPANWAYVGGTQYAVSCVASNDIACRIIIDEDATYIDKYICANGVTLNTQAIAAQVKSLDLRYLLITATKTNNKAEIATIVPHKFVPDGLGGYSDVVDTGVDVNPNSSTILGANNEVAFTNGVE